MQHLQENLNKKREAKEALLQILTGDQCPDEILLSIELIEKGIEKTKSEMRDWKYVLQYLP
jgi:hypothetical protein